MLENLIAERYDRDVDNRAAATEPSIMGCRGPDGTVVDVFVKCSSQSCPPGGLAREVICALLANELNIRVGRPVLVTVDDVVIDQIRCVNPSASARMRSSVIPMYGSVSLGAGYSLCRAGTPLGARAYPTAVEIWAFDQLLLNPDRNAMKPNCMLKGDELVMIDHEKALLVEGVGSFMLPAPWDCRWTPDVRHLFHEMVNKSPPDLGRLKEAWRTLNETEVGRLMAYIPASWDVSEVSRGIADYLGQLHTNLDMAFENLRGVRV